MKRRKGQIWFHALLAPHRLYDDPSSLCKTDENGLKRSHFHKFEQMHYLLSKFGDVSTRNKGHLNGDPFIGD